MPAGPPQNPVTEGRIDSRVREYEYLPWTGFGSGPLTFLVTLLVWVMIRRNDVQRNAASHAATGTHPAATASNA
jgi:hypothetical protein